jgi:membrane associated rhomboid family serine protease
MYYFYYLPIGTEIRLRKTPVVTIALVGLNVACFLASQLLGRGSSFFLGLAFIPARFELHTLVTSSFLHADIFHLSANLLYLWIFGSVLEDRMGQVRYLAAYLVCGVLSMMAQAVAVVNFLPQNAAIPVVGASGAISGLMGLFLIRFYYARVRVASLGMLFLQGVFRAAVSRMNAAGAMLLWIVIQLAYGLATSGNPLSATAYWSHISGFAMGLVLGLSGGLGSEATLERKLLRGKRYFERGKWFAAMGELVEFLRTRPGDAEARALLARTYLLTGQREKAAVEYSKAVVSELSCECSSAAIELYEEMKRVSPEPPLSPHFQLLMARCLEESGRPGLAADAYATFGTLFHERGKAPASLLKAAEIYSVRLNDLERAGELYRKVRAFYPQTRWAQISRRKLAEIGRVVAKRAASAPPVSARLSDPSQRN